MATQTVASVTYHNMGDVEAVSSDFTSVADGDTFTAPFSLIHNVVFTPTTSVLVVPTFSGRTITFKVAAGTIAGRLTIWGR